MKTQPTLSKSAKNFLFDHFDSAELIDVLVLMEADPQKVWKPENLAQELRSIPSSVTRRLETLAALKLISLHSCSQSDYVYRPETLELAELVKEITQAYKVHRHSVLEMIFSPLKKAKDFAEAFRLPGDKKPRRNND